MATAEETTRTPITIKTIVEVLNRRPRNPAWVRSVLIRAEERLGNIQMDEDTKMRIFHRLPCSCPKCGGDGTYKANDGKCFACIGKGFQTQQDRDRCVNHHGQSF